MNELLAKLSSYNLFNYLLPGVLFVVLSDLCTKHSFLQHDVVTGMFLYYFIGLVISRIGSLIVEPLLKKTGFLKFVDYKDFVAASKTDLKVEVLSEVNNTYRTLTALFVVLLIVKCYDKIEIYFGGIRFWISSILFVLLLTMFLFAYRKQTGYIVKRVKAAKP